MQNIANKKIRLTIIVCKLRLGKILFVFSSTHFNKYFETYSFISDLVDNWRLSG